MADADDLNSLAEERDALARELAERYEELHLIYDIDRLLGQQNPGNDVLREVLQICALQLDVDTASFVEPAATRVTTATNLSRPIDNLDLVETGMRGDLFRFVLAVRSTVVINEADDPRRRYVLTHMPFKILACPILLDKEIPAILVLLSHSEKPDFSNSDRRLAEVMANQIANILRMRRALGDLERFSGQLAAALVEIMEAKDPYIRGHSERVQHVASTIGEAMGLPERQRKGLYWAALFHDIGKVGIPDAVLAKPGRLMPDEYAFIKSHPERSYDILQHIDYLGPDALAGVRHHQECWNGSGYPMGLAESSIPVLARIVAVADTYDSITSSRAYRPGRTHEEALEEIVRIGGTQLDPNVVAIFQDICAGEPEWIARMGIRRRRD